ncbi:hypothetical protein BACI348_51024 [Bacillus altitudinis]|uniref:Uncharacterized protein n=1 Tax=Bacillus altitudinis TaxID=293387 RepID=A0A653Y3I2_BACAB|nr:hypothetical protein BACI348_51024 [Bacillus altitudinis]
MPINWNTLHLIGGIMMKKVSLLIFALAIVVFGQTVSYNSLNDTNLGPTERPIGT